MKKNINQIIAILIFLVFCIGSQAQDNRTLDTKVADILAQMPTKDITHRDKVMVEIISLGAEGFEKIAALLTPLGTGDDTAVRFALNSLARFSSEFGKNEARAFTEGQLLKAIKSHHNNEVKTFLMNQLNLVISENSISE